MSKAKPLDHYLKVLDDTLFVSLWYPRAKNNPNHVEVELIDVRAANSIRIRYDFDRDGWQIEQERNDPAGEHTDDWHEVAFVPARAIQ